MSLRFIHFKGWPLVLLCASVVAARLSSQHRAISQTP